LPEELSEPKVAGRADKRAVLAGVLFVLETGVPWEMRPRGM
jgi:hypothetical protein